MTDVLHMQVEAYGVRAASRRRPSFLPKVRAYGVAVIEREQELRSARLVSSTARRRGSAVSWDDAQPGVEQVVGLLEEAPSWTAMAFMASAV